MKNITQYNLLDQFRVDAGFFNRALQLSVAPEHSEPDTYLQDGYQETLQRSILELPFLSFCQGRSDCERDDLM